MRKRLIALAIMLTTITGVGVLFAPQAQAATQVAHIAINNIGFIDVYWDGYQNYAYTRHAGGTYGVTLDTYVDICRSDSAGHCTGPLDSQFGRFKYYAGPVWSGPSAGSCVHVKGFIATSGVREWTGACG